MKKVYPFFRNLFSLSFKTCFLLTLIWGSSDRAYAQNCTISAQWSSYSLGGDSMRFYAPDTNTAAHYIWNWGDGTYTSGVTVTNHYYTSPGTYHVCFYCYIPGTQCSDSLCENVTVRPPCTTTAQWSYYSLGGDSLRFYAYDTTSAAYHIWNWGDGTYTSGTTLTNHHYANPGTYRVCFYSYYTPGGCADSLCQYVTVGASCHAGFTYQIVPNTDSVIFTNTSTSSDSVISYSWGFGDSHYANGRNASHTYAQAGTYIVCLSFGDIGGCQSTKCDTIVIPPLSTCGQASFRDSIISSTSLYVYSTSTVYGSNNTYAWSVNGVLQGSPSSYVFATLGLGPGQNKVCLYLYHANNLCDSFCQYVTMPCNLNPAWSYTNIGGNAIKFYGEDTSSATHHDWNFGDGTYSSSNTWDPSHTYTQPGTYHVCLYVYIPGGCVDSFCQNVVVNPSTSCNITASWFDYSLGGDSMRFYTSDTNSAAHHIWVWGDGTVTSGTTLTNHTFPAAGTYHVCLYVYIPGANCSDSLCENVTVGTPPCTATAQWSSYDLGGDSVRFYAYDTSTAARFYWSWGDGTTSYGQRYLNHTFPGPGTYHVCLYMYVAGTNCGDSLCENITIAGSNIPCNIRYGWTYTITGGDTVTFNAEDTVSSAHHIFNFGDGTYSTNNSTHEVHVYTTAGTYHVCFYVYIPGTTCSDSFCQNITVTTPNPCHVDVQWSSYSLGGDSLRFYSYDTNTAAHHIWVWGDGTYTSGVTVTNHHYPQPGTYHVCYYVYIPGTDCSDSLCNNVTIVGDTNNCSITADWTSYSVGGDSIRFHATTVNTQAHYIWTFGDGTYAAATTDPLHTYTQPGTYHVCLYVYIPGTSCSDSSCGTVTIAPPGNPPCTTTANWAYYSEGGDTMRFYAADTNSAAHHIWVWGDGTYSSGTINTTHIFPGAGTYHVCFYCYIPGTSCSDSLCENIVVGGDPCHITAQWSAYSIGGDTVRFYSYDTNSVAHHIWVWGDGTYTSGSTSATHIYGDTGTYHVCYYVYIPGTTCMDSMCSDVTLSANGHFYLSAYFVTNSSGSDTVGFSAAGGSGDTSSAVYEIWSFGDGTYAFNTLNPSHVYTASGTYTVCLYIFIPGTDLADTVCQTINVVLGINNVTGQNIRIITQPNPFNQSILVRTEGLTGNFDFKLYDVVGKMLRYEKNVNGSFTLQRESLTSGMYVFEVIQDGNVIGTGKIIAE